MVLFLESSSALRTYWVIFFSSGGIVSAMIGWLVGWLVGWLEVRVGGWS